MQTITNIYKHKQYTGRDLWKLLFDLKLYINNVNIFRKKKDSIIPNLIYSSKI